MAVDAGRQFLLGLGDLAAVNRLLEFLGNTEMAFGAGCDDIGTVDTGPGVLGRQHTVGGMAVGAGCRHHKAGLGQAATVNTHLIVLDDLVLTAGIPERRFFSLAMAAGTEVRDIAGENRRLGVISGEDVVGTMTFGAGRRIGIIFGK